MSTYSIGISALQAAQAGLITTQHNIANAATPGFHRQQIIQGAAIPQQSGVGFLGQGVQVTDVQRLYSQFLTDQVMNTEAQGQYLNAYYGQVKQIDNLLADPNAGLSPSVQQFFSAVQELASNPSSAPARQSVLSEAQTLVSRFGTINQRLSDLRQDVNTQLSGTVAEINSAAKQIANLNEQIVLAQGTASATQSPNDLLDLRDKLVSDLNKLAKATVVKQYDGTLNVYIGNGQALVVGQRTFSLTVNQSAEDPDNLVIGYNSSGTTNTPISTASLGGGKLGGLLDFRSNILETAQNSLGRVAVGLAETFNSQHKLGVDLNGVLGKDFFSIAATSPSVSGNTNNTSGVKLTAAFDPNAAGSLTTGSYRITYDSAGANYNITDLTSNTSTTVAAASLSTAIGGITLSASGTPNNGDSFLVLPTRYGARDISVAITNTSDLAAAAPVQTSATPSNTGTGQISSNGVSSVATLPTASVTLTYDSSTSSFVKSSADPSYNGGAPIPYTSGSTISLNGVNFVITGTPANGDTFNISPNYGPGFTATSDNRNALQLTSLQTANTLVNNAAGKATVSYQSAYSQLVSTVGIKTREIDIRNQAQTSLIDQTRQAEQSLSGVNLDEEAANLVRYQQAYQAASKALEISSKLFDTILSLG
ncbi:flagellar hook-associated protein FlgK [Sulfurirhabdus autotrophica]|uniref:Flagellar hook-associated protein 1 n=1 Tax=Sulfurirhabdus autotrophica TaxID=1706046 RepID=A0A4R3YJ45_9PROT|nr:flagellar hook-associated protein FlgK [Sulfurirhabdus autotrophica]TCV90723.1 flagellar hook-associated protein 1 FlgK [Sulfurirhabdus autotrophica]